MSEINFALLRKMTNTQLVRYLEGRKNLTVLERFLIMRLSD